MNPGGRRGGKSTAPVGKSIASLGKRFRPGEWLRADAFPESSIAASAVRRGNEGYGLNQRANIARAVEEFKRAHPNILIKKKSGGASIAHVTTSTNRASGAISKQTLTINTAADFWKDPVGVARQYRRTGFMASSSPGHIIRHEMGHIAHKPTRGLRWASAPQSAGRVSRYARTDAMEFMAEVRGGLRSGQRFPARVMREYRQLHAASKQDGERNFRPRRIVR